MYAYVSESNHPPWSTYRILPMHLDFKGFTHPLRSVVWQVSWRKQWWRNLLMLYDCISLQYIYIYTCIITVCIYIYTLYITVYYIWLEFSQSLHIGSAILGMKQAIKVVTTAYWVYRERNLPWRRVLSSTGEQRDVFAEVVQWSMHSTGMYRARSGWGSSFHVATKTCLCLFCVCVCVCVSFKHFDSRPPWSHILSLVSTGM